MAPDPIADVLIAPLDQDASSAVALILARNLRHYGISCVVDGRTVRLKKKLQYADVLRSFFVVILGEAEVASGTVQLRDRDEHTDSTLQAATAAREIAVLIYTEPEVRRIEADLERALFSMRST
jgi:histidyl-tRNA synthetase